MRSLGIAVMLVMTAAIVYGFVAGTGFGEEGSQLLGLAWGRVTLIDLYSMLAVFAAWIWTREGPAIAAVWTVALLVLGAAAAGAYLVRAAAKRDALT